MKKSQQRNIYLHRLGCPKIDADHDLLRSGLEDKGLNFVEDLNQADTVILSTCAFIEDARKEAIDAILEASRWKELADNRKLFVTGCLPIRYENELRKEIPEVDDWFTFDNWDKVFQILIGEPDDIIIEDSVLEKPSSPPDPGKITTGLENSLAETRRSYSQPYAYLRIAEGCNRRCSYCAIPAMRGPYRSRPVESIIDEAHRLLDNNTSEIILVAQEVNSYGKDLGGTNNTIEELLDRLGAEIAGYYGDHWLRVLYTHPPIFTEDFIRALSRNPVLVPYLDFPIEHASDKVLKTMRRGTTWSSMKNWIERLRDAIPGIALRTSIIVGHPGEGTREFDELCSRLEVIRFERLGIFRYSLEEGTHAATLEAVDPEESTRRLEVLQQLADEIAEDWYSSLSGKNLSMIVEDTADGIISGRTIYDAPEIDGIAILDGTAEKGDIVSGIVTKTEPYLVTIKPDHVD